jgi:hypothetical protein
MKGETMNRRNFLSLMVGGVAAAAAVRSFPFQVFSFPKEIVVPERLSLYGLPYWETAPYTGAMYAIAREGVFEFDGPQPGWKKISQEIDIEEARRILPGPFRWQGAKGVIRRSLLMADGSVVDYDDPHRSPESLPPVHGIT